MNGPTREFRGYVHERAQELESEEQVDELLGQIEGALSEDMGAENPEEDLAAVEAWASVASYVVARFYAPASPWPRDVAGWSRKAAERLRRISSKVADVLRSIVGQVGATGFSIGVAFPWGISIALNW
jgi:hypothetical protein